MPRGAVGSALHALAGSLGSLMSNSFFITKEMRHQFAATRLSGTLPVLYAFLARSGKTIRDVSLIRLTQDGMVEAGNAPGGSAYAAHGAKIVFADENGREHTLYYFGTNIANDGFKQSGFARFCERLGSGDVFVKSASFLLHSGGFSDVRNFLLTHARTLLQDDTGVPPRLFGPKQMAVAFVRPLCGPHQHLRQHVAFVQPRSANRLQRWLQVAHPEPGGRGQHDCPGGGRDHRAG
jgi:hypothetical protein